MQFMDWITDVEVFDDLAGQPAIELDPSGRRRDLPNWPVVVPDNKMLRCPRAHYPKAPTLVRHLSAYSSSTPGIRTEGFRSGAHVTFPETASASNAVNNAGIWPSCILDTINTK